MAFAFIVSILILGASISAVVIGSLRVALAAAVQAERRAELAAFCAEYGQHDRSPKGAV